MRRRTVLATVGTSVLGGCGELTGESDVDEDGNGGDEAEDDDVPLQFERADQGTAFSNVRNATGLAEIDQFNGYRREPNEIDAEARAENVDAIDLTQQLRSGEYRFVFDNTYLGGAEPSGEVEVAFEFVLGP